MTQNMMAFGAVIPGMKGSELCMVFVQHGYSRNVSELMHDSVG